MINIAINGFGRIGRAALKAALENPLVNVVAINDLANPRTLAHLLMYDSVYGTMDSNIYVTEDGVVTTVERQSDTDDYEGEIGKEVFLHVDDCSIKMLSTKEPTELPWRELEVDVVFECTGVFTDFAKARFHIDQGAKKVIISAPAKGDGEIMVLGSESDNCTQDVFSMGSCTTNCVSPILSILSKEFGVEKSFMTTIHSYTADQMLVDGAHKTDLRRARAAGLNIVPTSTGAAKSVHKTVPSLGGKFEAFSVRVPTPCVSMAIINAVLKNKTTIEAVNETFIEYASTEKLQGILGVSHEPLVSCDFIGNYHSTIVDLDLTQIVDGDMVTVVCWYDNEWGFANRMIDTSIKLLDERNWQL